MMCHPTKDRPLSVAKYARIQQFPDDWKFIGTTVSKYKQIGNAVPVGLARAIGEMLISVANSNAEVVVKRICGTSIYGKIQGTIQIGGESIFMGTRPDEYAKEFEEACTKAANRMVREFTIKYGKADGSIDWDTLFKFNSHNA